MRLLAIAILVVAIATLIHAQRDSLQSQIKKHGPQLTKSVAPLFFWPADFPAHIGGVAGTIFFVSKDGHFITAAHVLRDVPAGGQLSLHLRQKNGGSASLVYEVLERDDARDLALGKAKHFAEYFEKNVIIEGVKQFDVSFLLIDKTAPEAGDLVLISGFPLGSWSPSMQMGMVAATETLNPNVPGVPAGRRELLQIDVSGNKGNSGGPVLSLRTGRVVGVVVQINPAPILGLDPNVAVRQNSGIVFAVPNNWILELLKKHKVSGY